MNLDPDAIQDAFMIAGRPASASGHDPMLTRRAVKVDTNCDDKPLVPQISECRGNPSANSPCQIFPTNKLKVKHGGHLSVVCLSLTLHRRFVLARREAKQVETMQTQ